MTLARAVAALLLGAALLPACSSAPRTISVDMRYSRYSPVALNVRAHETVRFKLVNEDPITHEFILGTAAASQSRGLGSALITDMLDRCDRQGLGAYLESSNIRNVPFYERHGFKVLSEIKISDGFTARPMWRDPRP